MKPATYVLVFLLCVDAIAWAHFEGLKSALVWLLLATAVAFAHRWLEGEDGKMPVRLWRAF